MFIKNKMTYHPYCIDSKTSISKALDIMSTHNFHRLPVVEDGKLIGLITEGIVRAHTPSQATSLSIYELNYLLSKTCVEEIMIKDVITIQADSIIEEAAVLMRKHNIGCLVVVDEQYKVTGIITKNDILDAFVDLLGYYRIGSRFVVRDIEDKPGTFNVITELLTKLNANIYNLGVYHIDNRVDVVIIAGGASHELMLKGLQDLGYEVIAMLNENGI